MVFPLCFWQAGFAEYDAFDGIDWAWLSMDGAMTKAALAEGKTGTNLTDRAKSGTKRSLLVEGSGVPVGLCVAGDTRRKGDIIPLGDLLWALVSIGLSV